MRLFALGVLMATLHAIIAGAQAQTYPTKPIVVVVPAPAGGPGDILGRVLSEPTRTILGQPLVIENVAGAGGTIGVGRVVRSSPDGYTVVLGQWNSSVASGAVFPTNFDLQKDLEPVILLTSSPLWLVGRKGLPSENLADLIAHLKAHPDGLNVGIAGTGTASHITAIHFARQTETKMRFVPYRGAGPAYQDLIAGHIDLLFAESSATREYVRAGSIKAYGVLARSRWHGAPEVASMAELGFPDLHMSFWQAIWAPKGTPKQVIAALNRAAREALADPVISLSLKEIGLEKPNEAQQTPEALAAHQAAEIERWWPIIKAANVKSN